MSVAILARVMNHSAATGTARLVLFVLADAAHPDGVCWLHQATIAERARCSEGHARESLKALVEAGEIELRKAQRGRKRINVYRVSAGAIEVDYDRLPFALKEPFDDHRSSAVVEVDDRADSAVVSPRARISSLELERKEKSSLRSDFQKVGGPKTVDRKPVTDGELTFAHTVLTAWNGRTGQSLTAHGWLAKIIMRHREHPEVTPQEHVAIIDRNLADPWWKGPASPSVIYGSDDQFERAMQVTGEVKRKETAIERWQREREKRERQRSNGDPDLPHGRVPPALEKRTPE